MNDLTTTLELIAERIEALSLELERAEATIKRVEDYSTQCAILRTEPTTAGLRKALAGEKPE